MNLIKKVVSGLTLCALVLLNGCSPAKKELVVHYGAKYETRDYQTSGLLFDAQKVYYLKPEYKTVFTTLAADANRLIKHLKQGDVLQSSVPESTYLTAEQNIKFINMIKAELPKEESIKAGIEIYTTSIQNLMRDLFIRESKVRFTNKGFSLPEYQPDLDMLVVFQQYGLFVVLIPASAINAERADVHTLNLTTDRKRGIELSSLRFFQENSITEEIELIQFLIKEFEQH
jgi:hypothetical protein